MDEARHVLVRVHLSDGAVGTAEALPRPTIYGETIWSVPTIIAHELSPRIIGEPADPAHIYPLLAQVKNNQTAKGAVDVALHHAIAQSNGVSLAEHLGCARERVRVSYILGIAADDEMLDDATSVFNQGVRVLKVKIGRDHAADIRRITLLQDTFSGELDIYVDANETMGVDNAAARLAQFREMGILYCEEPLPVHLPERTALRAGNHLPIIGDDSCFTLADVRRECAADTFDILNIKTARTGYTESLQMLDVVQRYGKGTMIGSHAASRLGASRSGIFASLSEVNHPSELTFFLKMKEDIVATPPPIVDGYVALSDLLNVAVDDDLLRSARLS